MSDPVRSRDERFEIRAEGDEKLVVHVDSDTVIARYPRDANPFFNHEGTAVIAGDAKVELDYLMRAAEAAARGETLATAKDFEIRRRSELNQFVESFGDSDEEQRDYTFEVIHRPSGKVVATFTGWEDHQGNSSGTRSLDFSEDGLALLVDGQRVELAELLGRNGPRKLRRKKR